MLPCPDWLDVGGPHNWTSLFIAEPKLPHNLELLFSEILNLQTSQCQNNSVTKLVLLTLSLTANISMLQNWMLIDPNAVISLSLHERYLWHTKIPTSNPILQLFDGSLT